MTIEPIESVRSERILSAEPHPATHRDLAVSVVDEHVTDPGGWDGTTVAERVPQQDGAPSAEAAETTRSLLQLAGIEPSDDDVVAMSGRLAAARAAVRCLYAVPEARYESPGLAFRAAP